MNKKQKPLSLVDALKMKALEFGLEYFKKHIKTSKEEVLKYVEKQIENKIKKELQKHFALFISFILIGFGLLFLSYGLFEIILKTLSINTLFLNLFFGLFLIILSMLFYLFYL